MRTPKAFKPVLESSGTDKRSNFIQDKILLTNGGGGGGGGGGNLYEKKLEQLQSSTSKKSLMSYLRCGSGQNSTSNRGMLGTMRNS